MTGINITGSYGHIWNRKGHISTIGFARSGKGTCIILPALLHDNLINEDAPSFICLDPKGENLAVAGNHLRDCGYNIIALNPFDVPVIRKYGNQRFNPFDLLDPDKPGFNKYVDLIRYSIIPPNPNKHANSFFSEAAGDILSLYISYLMVQETEPQTIKTLYRWLRLAGTDRIELLNAMAGSPYFDIGPDAMAIMQQLLEGGKGITDVYANVISETNVFKDEDLRYSMSDSDFTISSIARQKTAVFISMEPSDLKRVSAWVRIIMAAFMRGMTRFSNPGRMIVMIMDEFPTIGYLKEFEEGMGYLAQYMTLWPICQDLNQLKGLYPNSWETFMANAAIKHWMVRDNFTAQYLSKRMPNDIRFLGSNADGSPKYIEKPLMTPVEIMNCSDFIVEVEGMSKPAKLTMYPYWKFTGNYTPNPYY